MRFFRSERFAAADFNFSDTDTNDALESVKIVSLPGPAGRGLSVALAPTWGAASSGVEGLWSRQTTQGLAPQETTRAPVGRPAAEVATPLRSG